MTENAFILTLSSKDQPGIVASVTTELADAGANIAESAQFWDRQSDRFFLRIAFTAPTGTRRDALERAPLGGLPLLAGRAGRRRGGEGRGLDHFAALPPCSAAESRQQESAARGGARGRRFCAAEPS